MFVAAGSTVFGLRVDCTAAAAAALPSSIDVSITAFTTAQVAITFPTNGEARGLAARGPFLFVCDNNGIGVADLRTCAATDGKPGKWSRLTNTNKTLGVMTGGKFNDITDITVLQLSTEAPIATATLSNYLIGVARAGKVLIVEADDPMGNPGGIQLQGPDATASRLSYDADSQQLFVLDAHGCAVYVTSLEFSGEISRALEAAKLANSMQTPPRSSTSSKRSTKSTPQSSAKAAVAPVPTVVASVWRLRCDWVSGAGVDGAFVAFAVDASDGTVFLSKSSTSAGVVAALIPDISTRDVLAARDVPLSGSVIGMVTETPFALRTAVGGSISPIVTVLHPDDTTDHADVSRSSIGVTDMSPDKVSSGFIASAAAHNCDAADVSKNDVDVVCTPQIVLDLRGKLGAAKSEVYYLKVWMHC